MLFIHSLYNSSPLLTPNSQSSPPPPPSLRHLRLRPVGRRRSEAPGQASEERWKNPPTSAHYGARCSETVQGTRKRKQCGNQLSPAEMPAPPKGWKMEREPPRTCQKKPGRNYETRRKQLLRLKEGTGPSTMPRR